MMNYYYRLFCKLLAKLLPNETRASANIGDRSSFGGQVHNIKTSQNI